MSVHIAGRPVISNNVRSLAVDATADLSHRSLKSTATKVRDGDARSHSEAESIAFALMRNVAMGSVMDIDVNKDEESLPDLLNQ